MFTWYEFFAGGGMARLGMGKQWKCLLANEWCPRKAAAYRAYFGECDELKITDLALLTARDLPGHPGLIWASFPCQDLSLAGNGAGLAGKRSGTFGPFWALARDIISQNRAPKIVVLENVVGTITSHGGRDFESILRHLTESGYRAGAVVIDALLFLPQSRPRLFIVAARSDIRLTPGLCQKWPSKRWHTPALQRAYANLPTAIQTNWIWWHLPEPHGSISKLSDLIETEPAGVKWHTKAQTSHLLAMMSDVNKAKLREVQAWGEPAIGTVYRRTRPDASGRKQQRAEVRFDEISGCLRTPVGGSSRQTVLVVKGKQVGSRLLSPREAARLMGVPEDYPLPANYNEAYHLFGDGLAVPVVRWLETHLLRPLAMSGNADQIDAHVA